MLELPSISFPILHYLAISSPQKKSIFFLKGKSF